MRGKRAMKVTLRRVDAGSRGPEIVLSRFPVTVGRGSTADIRIPDPTVSRLHCTLDVADEVLVARNCSASNGMLVNEMRVQTARLQPGDLLSFGDVIFSVQYRHSWAHRIRGICGKWLRRGERVPLPNVGEEGAAGKSAEDVHGRFGDSGKPAATAVK
jgi:pSer/pThr/pTyr-binding forkhead associated (FHA) protein